MANTRTGAAGIVFGCALALASPALAATAVDENTIPDGEKLFIAAVQKGREAFHAGGDDAQKAAAKAERTQALCKIVQSFSLVNWRGRVAQPPVANGPKGVMSLVIADDTFVTTGNSSSSDASNNDLIAADSALFRRISAYKPGDVVNFSGSFAKSGTECVRDAGATLAESMEQPAFIFLFTDVSR